MTIKNIKYFSKKILNLLATFLILVVSLPQVNCGSTSSEATQGAVGPQGPQGVTGPQGPEGAQGSAGANWRPAGTTATAMTAVGGVAVTVNGTASASAQTDSYYISWASAATANSVAGLTQGFTQTQGRYRPKLTTVIRTDTTTDNRRIWIALTSASLSTSDGIGALATRYVGLRHSSAVGDVNWQCASGDGTTGSVVDTGVPVSASTAYTVVIDWTVDGTLTCAVNGVSVTKTTELDSTQTANLGIQNSLTTLTALARNHRISYIRIQYTGNDF